MASQIENYSIAGTEYEDYFNDSLKCQPGVLNTIRLLGTGASEGVWDEYIEKGKNSFFQLSDECWIIKSKWETVGDWISCYNQGNLSPVSNLLREAVSWEGQDVFFCINRKRILLVPWNLFLLSWDCFLAIYDDCPIIIPASKTLNQVVVFKAIGSFSTVKRIPE